MTVPVMQPDHHQYSQSEVNIGGGPKKLVFFEKIV